MRWKRMARDIGWKPMPLRVGGRHVGLPLQELGEGAVALVVVVLEELVRARAG